MEQKKVRGVLSSVRSLLEREGLTVVPKALIDQIKQVQVEEIIAVEEKLFVIRPAEVDDLEQIHKGSLMFGD